MSRRPLAMANEQQTRFAAQAKHQKPVFAIRTLFVEELDGELIVENSPCLVERNPRAFSDSKPP